MPQFPLAAQLDLPCLLERVVPGRLHADGRRYLPLLLLLLADELLLGITDRHHVVDQALAGNAGSAKLVLLLSTVALQQGERWQGLRAEPAARDGRAATAPEAAGVVVAVPTWELRRGQLPYETLYTEVLLDVGLGVVGLRTNITAPSVAAALGTERIVPGDALLVRRSRIDILGFTPERTGATGDHPGGEQVASQDPG